MNALQRGIVAILGAAVLFSCRDDEDSLPILHDPGAGGESSAAGANSVAGGSEPTSGGAPQSEGGRPEAPSPGGEAGEGGSAGALGGAAGAPQGGAAGSSDTPGEQLDTCGRLTSSIIHIDALTRAYTTATLNDCRVDLLFPRNEALAGFRNRLDAWALRLWGCQGESVTTFGLAPDDAQLSAGDATILIDDYTTAARTELGLSDPEFAEARAALERLASSIIVSDSSEPSRSHCAGGAGGAGGGSP